MLWGLSLVCQGACEEPPPPQHLSECSQMMGNQDTERALWGLSHCGAGWDTPRPDGSHLSASLSKEPLRARHRGLSWDRHNLRAFL